MGLRVPQMIHHYLSVMQNVLGKLQPGFDFDFCTLELKLEFKTL